jgi:hypothetical protein
VRFRHLVEHGIVANWPSLLRLISEEGFPAGAMLGRNTRAFPLDLVEAWLAARPTARKIVPPAKRPRRKRQEIESPVPPAAA